MESPKAQLHTIMVKETIAEGSYGKIFSGLDTSNDKQVALKFISDKKGKEAQ